MRCTGFLAIGSLSFVLFTISSLLLFRLQKSFVKSSEPRNVDTELVSRIKKEAGPISLSSPSSSPNRFVIMTVGTYAYRDFIHNLACTFQWNNATFQILLISLDERLHNFSMPPNVHSVYFNVTNKEYAGEERAASYGSEYFDVVTRQKFTAIRSVLSAGYDVLYTDGDVVWCDPSWGVMDIASQAHPSRAPFVFQSAHNSGQTINTGLFYAVSSSASRSFLHAVEMRPSEEGNDQEVANYLACDEDFGGVWLDDDHCRWKNRTDIRLLTPESKYILGASRIGGIQMRKLNTAKLNQLCNSKTIAVMHYSYYGYIGKRRGIQKAGFWFFDKRTPGRCSKLEMNEESKGYSHV